MLSMNFLLPNCLPLFVKKPGGLTLFDQVKTMPNKFFHARLIDEAGEIGRLKRAFGPFSIGSGSPISQVAFRRPRPWRALVGRYLSLILPAEWQAVPSVEAIIGIGSKIQRLLGGRALWERSALLTLVCVFTIWDWPYRLRSRPSIFLAALGSCGGRGGIRSFAGCEPGNAFSPHHAGRRSDLAG